MTRWMWSGCPSVRYRVAYHPVSVGGAAHHLRDGEGNEGDDEDDESEENEGGDDDDEKEGGISGNRQARWKRR